jgi:hypothetical protein
MSHAGKNHPGKSLSSASRGVPTTVNIDDPKVS